MRFERLDLNLLVALDALLTEKSVSLAAERICLSQSATSSALGRLRDYFGDDLLVVKGRQMVLTARGESLVEPVRAVLEQIKSTIAVTPIFDPATSDRSIAFMASDYAVEVLLADALRDIAGDAPNMRFEIQPMYDQPVEALERGQIDLLVTVDFAISTDHPSEILFEDDYVVVGCSQNPSMQGEMSEETYFNLGHVTARFGKTRVLAFDDWFTRRQSRERRIEVVAPSFLSIPALLINTHRIATMHRRLALSLAKSLPLIVRETPLVIPPIREAVQWDIANSNDPAIRWVVERLVAIARDKQVSPSNVVPMIGHEALGREFKSSPENRFG
jgi:LysR family transcriptional regulator, nod-box dependent transcriptional activator